MKPGCFPFWGTSLFLEFYGSLSESLSQNYDKQHHITYLSIKGLIFVPEGNWDPVRARMGHPHAQLPPFLDLTQEGLDTVKMLKASGARTDVGSQVLSRCRLC